MSVGAPLEGATPRRQSGTEDPRAVENAVARYLEACSMRDGAALARIYPGQSAEGREKLLEGLRRYSVYRMELDALVAVVEVDTGDRANAVGHVRHGRADAALQRAQGWSQVGSANLDVEIKVFVGSASGWRNKLRTANAPS